MRVRNPLARIVLSACVLASSGRVGVHAQEEPPLFEQPTRIDLLGVEDAFDAKIVRKAPYQARAITEIVQVLADGNRISNTVEGRVWRDGEGRTRREHAVAAIGALVTAGEAPRVILLRDPVSGNGWRLDPDHEVAFPLRAPNPGRRPSGPRGMLPESPPPGPRGMKSDEPLPLPVSESLGRKSIEGIEADGVRYTFTLAPGSVGNEKPIQIVHERWYAPELQVIVASTRKDPRVGVTSYRLVDIRRAEPEPSLFKVPPHYRIAPPGPEPPRPPDRRDPGDRPRR